MAQPHYVQTLGTYATDYLDEHYPKLMHHARRLRAVMRRDEYYGPIYFAHGEWCSPFDDGAVQFDYVGAIVNGNLITRVYIGNRASAALRSFRQEVGK